MPLNVNLPGVGIIAVPDNLTPDEQANFVRRAAMSKGLLLEPPKPSMMERAGGVGAGLISGVGSLVEFPGQVAGIAGLAPMDNMVTRAGESISKFGQGLKPETIKGQEEARRFEIEQAAKEGLASEFGTAIGSTLSRPGLLGTTIAESLPSLAGTGLGGFLTKGAVKAGATTLGKELTEKAAQRAALAGGVGAGATMQGADIGADTYQAVMKDESLPETREYQRLAAQGLDDAAIRQTLALESAQKAAAGAAAISIGTQFLPGGASIEKILAGQKLGRGIIGGALKGGAGEALQESLEEGGGKFVSNIARPGEQPMLAGVGEAAGLGAVGGLGLGGGAGAIAGAIEGAQDRRQRALEEQAAVTPEEPPVTPLDKNLLTAPPAPSLFTPEVDAALSGLPKDRPFTLDDVSSATSGVSQTVSDAPSVANELLRRGFAVQQPTSNFSVRDAENRLINTFVSREEADAAAQSLNGTVVEEPSFRILDESERLAPIPPGNVSYLYGVPTTQEGEEVADKYRVTVPGMKFKRDLNTAEEAQNVAAEIGGRIRAAAEQKFDPQIKQRKKAIQTIDTALEEASLRTNVSDRKLTELNKAAEANKAKLQAEIESLEAKKAAAIKEPSVEPINPRRPITNGYEVRAYIPDAEPQTLQFFPTREEAQEFIANNALPEQADAIRQAQRPEPEITRIPSRKPVTPKAVEQGEETVEPTPEFSEKIQAISSRLRPVLDQMGLKNIGLNIQQRLNDVQNGKLTPINGYYFNKVIAAAIEGDRRKGMDVTATVGHETIHALRELGMFSDKEWQILSRKARSTWMKKYDIEERYEGVQVSEEEMLEEAVADAFGDWFNGRLKETGVIQGLFNRIKNFLERVGTVFRGQGFTTSSDVFQRAFKGELQGERVEAKPGAKKYERTTNVADMTERRERQILKEEEEESRQLINQLKSEKAKKDLAFVGDEVLPWFKSAMTLIDRANKLNDLGLQVETPIALNNVNEFWNILIDAFDKLENNEDAGLEVNNLRFHMGRANDYKQALRNYTDEVRSYGNSLPNRGRAKPIKNSISEIIPPVIKPKFSLGFDRVKEPNFKSWFGNSKMVNGDGTPQIWYHGTGRDIEEFVPKQAKSIFVTQNPNVAEGFAGTSIDWMITNAEQILDKTQIEQAILNGLKGAVSDGNITPAKLQEYKRLPFKTLVNSKLAAQSGNQELSIVSDYVRNAVGEMMPTGENIIPLVVRAEKPFDFENKENIAEFRNWLGTLDKNSPARIFLEDEMSAIMEGSWERIESPAFQSFLKERGYDSYFVYESGIKNLAVYDPNQLKSPFNSGLWGESGKIRYSMPFNVKHEEPRILKNGEVVGSPPNARTVAAREGLVQSMTDLLTDPFSMLEDSYEWYEKSGAAIRRIARGDKALTERMVRLFALYSQANGVGANTTAVIKSIAQLARGEQTAFAGRFPNTTAARIPAILSAPTMDDSLPGVDDKLMNFYRNLHDGTYQTDTFDGASTIDRWMMRLFGYPHTDDQEVGGSSAVSNTQYAYAKDLTRRIADEHLKRTGQRLKPHQVQAVLWTYVKNTTDYNDLPEEKRKDFKPSIVDFSDYIRRATANITWESRPSTSVDLLPGIHFAPREQQSEFNRDVRALFVDETGVDLLLRALNADPLYTSNTSVGAYDNRITPNVVTEVVLGKDDKGYVTDIATKYAAALGYILQQDAVPWYRADPTASGKLASKGYRVTLKEGTITPAMEDALFNHLDKVMPKIGFTRVAGGLDFINFRGEDGKPFFMPDKQYESALKNALESFDQDVEFSMTPFKTESAYIFNDWKENPDGQGYLESFSPAELTNLQGFFDNRRKAYTDLAAEYAERYGWDKAPTEDQRIEQEVTDSAKATLDAAAAPPQKDKKLSVPFKSAKAGADSIDSLVGKIPLVGGLANKILDIGANNSALIYKFLTLGQLAEVVGERLPQVKKYHETLKDMFGYRDTLINGAAKIAEDWQGLTAKNPTVANNMANIMHDATMAGFDPSPDRRKAPAANATEQDIQKRFDALPEEYKALYKKVRNYYSWRMSEYMKLLETRIEEAVQDKNKARELMMRLKDRYETGKVPQPYFPLARFGDYWLYFERNGQPEYHMFENVRERDTFALQVAAEGVNNIERGVRLEGVLDAGKSAFGFIKDVMDNLDASKTSAELKDDIWQMYLQHLPEVSMRKHFIHRKNVLGFNNDALRAFQTNAFHGAYYMGRLKYSGIAADQLNGVAKEAQALARANDDFATQAGEVFNELVARQAAIMNPSDSNVVTQLAGSAGFAYYLATPAAALVNLTQNLIVGLPVMGAKFGYGRASTELSLAMKQFISSAQFSVDDMNVPEVEKGLKNSFDIIRTLEQLKKDAKGNPALVKKYDLEIAAINEMYLNGTITRSQSMDLAGATDSATLAGGKLATMNRFLGMAFHGAEVFNRTTTAMAAYRMAMKQLEKSAPQLSVDERHKRAVRMSSDIVEKSHFNYSDANTAPFLKSLGSLGKVIFMFKKYAQAMTYLLTRETQLYGKYLINKYKGTPMEEEAVQRAIEARDTMLGVLGMTATFAGVMGLPFPLMTIVVGMFNMAFGDDDDETFDAETRFKNWLAETFGADAAVFIANGPVSYLTGADFAGRVGLNGLWFRDINQPRDEVDAVTQFYIQIGGPAFGMIMNTARGMQQINEGNVSRGVETMLPNILKDQFQAYRYATEGVMTLSGDPVLDEVSTYETFLTAIGFTPSNVARQYKENNEIKGAETRINNRRKRILGRFALALNNDDFGALDEIYDDIESFNSEFPEYPITGETLTRSIRSRQQAASEMEHGVRVNKRLRETLGEGRYLED